MTQADKRARFYFYAKDLDKFASLPTTSSGLSAGTPTALKHWAVKLDYMSTRDPSKVNKRILYEANNEKGLLVARAVMLGEDEDEEWRQGQVLL